MKTIEIYEPDDVIYFLSNSEGFVKGKVKDIHYDKTKKKFFYFVTCTSYNNEYQGDKKYDYEIFKNAYSMIEHYAEKLGICNLRSIKNLLVPNELLEI